MQSAKAQDVIALLKKDHADVKKRFKELEETDRSDEKKKIAAEICEMLSIHATCEEELVYPVAHDSFETENVDLVNEAMVEHATAKNLIAQIEAMEVEDEMFGPTVKVLSEYINHHVQEEEGQLFPKLKKAGVDLADLGEAVASRKAELAERSSAARKGSTPRTASARASAGQRQKSAGEGRKATR